MKCGRGDRGALARRLAPLAVAAWIAAVTFAAPRSALANGRFPQANKIFFSPTDPSFVGIRATFGILLSHDAGSTWAWLCEDALGIATSTEDPPLEVTASGSIVAALSIGLDVSLDGGCSWNLAGGPLSGQVMKDVALRPNAPDTVLAVTGTYEADAGSGESGFAQQVYESADDGAHWAPLGAPIDPTALVTTIDAAASDPDRLYASAVRRAIDPQSGLAQVTGASLFVSTDSGATWNERAVPFNPALGEGMASVADDGTAVFIAAVDPTDADVVYVRSDGLSQLFVTRDAGVTWSVALSLQDPMLGFALSGDGSRVYAGSLQAGVLAASAPLLSFTQVSSVPVQCLAGHGNDLWACADGANGFIAGQSTTGGASFAARLPNLLSIDAPIQCAATAVGASCATFAWDASPPVDPFNTLCTTLQACQSTSAGDAGPAPLSVACTSGGQCPEVDGGATATRRASKSAGGCSTGPAPSGALAGLAAALLCAAALHRKRARRAWRAPGQGSTLRGDDDEPGRARRRAFRSAAAGRKGAR